MAIDHACEDIRNGCLSRGNILVDGNDLEELDVRSWRGKLGAVEQDVVLFNKSVKDNISFLHEFPTVDRVTEAAKKAYAHDFISELPHRYGDRR